MCITFITLLLFTDALLLILISIRFNRSFKFEFQPATKLILILSRWLLFLVLIAGSTQVWQCAELKAILVILVGRPKRKLLGLRVLVGTEGEGVRRLLFYIFILGNGIVLVTSNQEGIGRFLVIIGFLTHFIRFKMKYHKNL